MSGNDCNRNYPYNFHGSAIPSYVSTTSFSLSTIAEKSQDGLIDMTSSTSTTINISTTGAGGIMTSANLTGTVAIVNASATVTGTGTTFTTTFIVGDVITISAGSTYYGTITAIGSDTSLTCAANFTATGSGYSYKRGGLSVSTFYYLYVIASAIGGTVSAALSTRSVATGDTLVDLPSGYTKYRQLAFAILTNTSSQIFPFKVVEGWPHRPVIFYNKGTNPTDATTLIYSGSGSTSATAISCSAFLPYKISNAVLINTLTGSSNAVAFYVRHGSTTSNNGQLLSYPINQAAIQNRVGLDGSGNFNFLLGASVVNTYKFLLQGYIVTGVP